MTSERPLILLVDDEPANLRALERTLRNQFEIQSFESPLKALDAVAKEEFAVVVSDQRMAEMKGSEFLARVAENSPLTTRIILTAHTETTEILDSINSARIYRYVTKPWDNQELQTILIKAVEYHRLKKENQQLVTDLESKNSRLLEKENELLKLNEHLETLVDQRTAELKIANEKLSELAMTDPLTNLLNRRSFFTKFNEELIRSSRYNHTIAFAMIDVDHFKEFNDMEGHIFGDEALRKVARVFLRNIRKTDVLARYGGEEFCLLMPETKVEVGADICERLRSAVENTQFQGKTGTAFLTISIGLSGYPLDGDNTNRLVEAADQALYEAKRSGRNQVVTQDGNESVFVS